jgi:hypothetical protein
MFSPSAARESGVRARRPHQSPRALVTLAWRRAVRAQAASSWVALRQMSTDIEWESEMPQLLSLRFQRVFIYSRCIECGRLERLRQAISGRHGGERLRWLQAGLRKREAEPRCGGRRVSARRQERLAAKGAIQCTRMRRVCSAVALCRRRARGHRRPKQPAARPRKRHKGWLAASGHGGGHSATRPTHAGRTDHRTAQCARVVGRSGSGAPFLERSVRLAGGTGGQARPAPTNRCTHACVRRGPNTANRAVETTRQRGRRGGADQALQSV